MALMNRKYPKNRTIWLLFFALFFLMEGCGIRKTVPKGSFLLKKNSVILHEVTKRELINDTGAWTAKKRRDAKLLRKRTKVTKTEVTAQILHRANKRVIFGKMPVYLWIYDLGTSAKYPYKNDSTKWRKKLRNNLGEPPVILDSNLISISANNIRNYLFNIGFLDAKVTFEVDYGKRKASVRYIVNPGRAYLINSFFVQCDDTANPNKLKRFSSLMVPCKDSILIPLVREYTQQSDDYRLWWPININKLNESRKALSSRFRNQGYYTVTPESFHFFADTLSREKQVNLNIILYKMPGGGNHVRYKFDQVVLNFETSKVYGRTNNPVSKDFRGLRINLNHYPINPELLQKLIFIDSGEYYSQSATEKTYQSLVQLGLFSVVDMRFFADTQNHRIRTFIQVKTLPRLVFSLEPQGLYSPQGSSGLNFTSTAQRSFGVAGILSFGDRNLAKNAENFRLSSVTSYEAIFKRESKGNFRYGFQQGFNASLSLPHFQLFKKTLAKGVSQRNTVLSLSYQYEDNPNFFRSAIPASLTLQYVKPKLSWYYTPTEVSFNRNILSNSFIQQLSAEELAFIQRIFTNQFVTAAKVGLIYLSNRTKPGETYIFARAGFEASGNLHRLIRQVTTPNFSKDQTYTLFGLQYFQYSKIEGELRLRRNLDELNSLAFRIHGGVAIPYGNSSAVPYDKRFFIGGSNSLRAWRPRRLGPGSTPENSNLVIDRSGEFLAEANLEYRFSLIRHFLESALFLDAGNIWNLDHKGQAGQSYTLLDPSTFFNETALNTGLGFRFDFKIFLFRVDWGIPLHDPSKTLGNRWLLNSSSLADPWGFTKRETALAIGIGYPF